MPYDGKPDLLAKVREAGRGIRGVLAENMRARIGDVVEMGVIAETRVVLASVLQTFLAQIVPNVQVKGLTKTRTDEENPTKIEFELSVSGVLPLSIEPGAEDDTLPEPEKQDSRLHLGPDTDGCGDHTAKGPSKT